LIGIDVNKSIQNDLLHIYQVPSLTDYHPTDIIIIAMQAHQQNENQIPNDEEHGLVNMVN
jgi:hypothetical protein